MSTAPSTRTVIRAEYARMIQPFISKEETCHYLKLNGFYVEPHPSGKGVLIVATDGHVIGVFHDADGVCSAPAIVRLDTATLAACKSAEGDEFTRLLAINGDAAGVVFDVAGDDALKTKIGDPSWIHAQAKCLIDGIFPNWRCVIPAIPAKPALATFASAVLDSFAGVPNMSGGPGAIRIFAKDATGPAIVLAERNDFFGVIMPYRAAYTEASALPAWFTGEASDAQQGAA